MGLARKNKKNWNQKPQFVDFLQETSILCALKQLIKVIIMARNQDLDFESPEEIKN